MATATVTGINLHDVSDYSTVTALRSSEITRSSGSPTRVERMVTGRLIAVTAPGVVAGWQVSIPFAARSDIEWLRSREGDTFFVRTDHGEAFFATLNGIEQSEQLLAGAADASPVGSASFYLIEVTLTVEV